MYLNAGAIPMIVPRLLYFLPLPSSKPRTDPSVPEPYPEGIKTEAIKK